MPTTKTRKLEFCTQPEWIIVFRHKPQYMEHGSYSICDSEIGRNFIEKEVGDYGLQLRWFVSVQEETVIAENGGDECIALANSLNGRRTIFPLSLIQRIEQHRSIGEDLPAV